MQQYAFYIKLLKNFSYKGLHPMMVDDFMGSEIFITLFQHNTETSFRLLSLRSQKLRDLNFKVNITHFLFILSTPRQAL